MKIFDIKDEDFVNYKEPSMFVAMGRCNYKCCREAGITLDNCQNHRLHMTKKIETTGETLFRRFVSNPISKAIVLGGLDPMDTFEDVIEIVQAFRMNGSNSEFVIYTGHTREEVDDKITELKKYKNIIVKFGRYVPNDTPHKDDILGINLISSNQYAEKIS